MPLITIANLEHAYGSHVVLDGATMSIEPGEKIGFVGRNGCGKTTLMRCVLGEITPDSGSVQLQRGARVGYLSQDPKFDAEDTVRIAAMGAFEKLHDLHHILDGVFHDMVEADGDELERLLKRQVDLEARIEAEGGYAIDHKVDATLHGLGFTDDQFDLSVTVLSGGQLNRLGLARLLLQAPDLLLLDEPTNHLDIDGRRWLENFLIDEYSGAALLVSHDRWLLDRVVTRMVEVDRGVTHDYPGNYHKYVELRRERQLTRARAHDKQLDKIRQEEQFIRRYKTGQRAKQARGRQSRLERFKRDELVERPHELSVMRLKLPEAPRSGEQVVIAEGISKAYDELTLFEDVELRISRGDRIGIIGPNGTGKTTLIRCLLNELEPDAGSVRLGSRVSVGVYRQLHDHLDLSLSVWQYLQSVIVSLDGGTIASEQQARDLAGAFLFSGIEQDKALQDLSGGERSRAVLAGLVAAAHNLLVLDEPTNHLDVPSAERLEQALSLDGGYSGALILVSHDRALLEATCDKLLIFDGKGGVRLFQGRYTDWLAQQRREASGKASKPDAAGQPKKKNASAKAAGKGDAGSSGKNNPLSNLSVEKIEQRIEEIETAIAAADQSLLDPDVYTDGDRVRDVQARRGKLVEQLEPLEKEWARRADA